MGLSKVSDELLLAKSNEYGLMKQTNFINLNFLNKRKLKVKV